MIVCRPRPKSIRQYITGQSDYIGYLNQFRPMRCDGTLTGALGKMHPCPVKTNERCGSVSAMVPAAYVKINRDLISNGVKRLEERTLVQVSLNTHC